MLKGRRPMLNALMLRVVMLNVVAPVTITSTKRQVCFSSTVYLSSNCNHFGQVLTPVFASFWKTEFSETILLTNSI